MRTTPYYTPARTVEGCGFAAVRLAWWQNDSLARFARWGHNLEVKQDAHLAGVEPPMCHSEEESRK